MWSLLSRSFDRHDIQAPTALRDATFLHFALGSAPGALRSSHRDGQQRLLVCMEASHSGTIF